MRRRFFALIISCIFLVGAAGAQDQDAFRDASGIFISSDNFDTDGDGSPDEEPYADSWGYSNPPNGDPNHYPSADYGEQMNNKDTHNGYAFGYACFSGTNNNWPSVENCFREYQGGTDGYSMEADDWWMDLGGEYRISDMSWSEDHWAYSNPPGGDYGASLATYFAKMGGPYQIPQDIPLPVGTFQTEMNVEQDGTVYTNKNGKIEVNPHGGDNERYRHKWVFMFVRMEIDGHSGGDPDSTLHNFLISGGYWNKEDIMDTSEADLMINAIDEYDTDYTSSEGDRYCSYHVEQGFLGGDSGNNKLDDLVDYKVDCTGETGATAASVKNKEFGTVDATNFKDPDNGGGCAHGCDINSEWNLKKSNGIHDFGRYAPVGEVARGTFPGESFEWWFVCRGSFEHENITVNGQDYICTVPDGQFGGNFIEKEDCRPGFSFEYRENTGWDCYSDDTEIINVNFLRIHNVRDAGEGYEAGLMIEDTELQKFDQVFGMPVTKITAECWIGGPGEEPASASPKALMETDPTSSYSSTGYEGEVWMLDDMETTSGVDETTYTCIYSLINDEGSEKVYEGSNDPPLKTSTSTMTIDVSDLPYSFTWSDGFVFDYPYPSGNFPNGDYYNEDPDSYHAFPYF